MRTVNCVIINNSALHVHGTDTLQLHFGIKFPLCVVCLAIDCVDVWRQRKSKNSSSSNIVYDNINTKIEMRQGMDCSCACFTAAFIPIYTFTTTNPLILNELEHGQCVFPFFFVHRFVIFIGSLLLVLLAWFVDRLYLPFSHTHHTTT